MTNFADLLRRLSDEHVEFVLVGGLAVISHGHVRATLDLDVFYARTPENLERLVRSSRPCARASAARRPSFRSSGTPAP